MIRPVSSLSITAWGARSGAPTVSHAWPDTKTPREWVQSVDRGCRCSLATALGDGFSASCVLIPLWSQSPPSSFSIIQPGTRGSLQRLWIPVHVAITLCIMVALVMTWGEPTVCLLLLVTLAASRVMRVWSGLLFIPEMLALQKVPRDEAPSAALSARVARWTLWTWLRAPLDVIAFVCALLALYGLKRGSGRKRCPALRRPTRMRAPFLPMLHALAGVRRAAARCGIEPVHHRLQRHHGARL
jgi:hypothetical protein